MAATSTIYGFAHSVGRTGIVTPVALIKPVSCGGVTISRISLMNWDEIERLEDASGNVLGVGSTVNISRAGDVIPRIDSILASAAERVEWPRDCPSCGSELFRDGPRITCQNPACPAQTARQILHWIKERNILFLGKAGLASLMEAGLIESVADLYRLDPQEVAKVLGAAMTEKILHEIEKSRTCSVAQAVGCVGIPGFGVTEMTKVCNHLHIDTLEGILDLPGSNKEGELRRMGGLGAIKIGNLLGGISDNHNLLCVLTTLLKIASPTPSTPVSGEGPTFCITGATELARHELIRLLTEKGWRWHSSVVNGLTYLISAEADSGSKKTRDAQKKGVQVITESQALRLAGVDG
jgi:DNA ligase (NAD+)